MRLRWLLIAVVTMSLMPSLASARSQIRTLHASGEAMPYSIGAAIEGGVSSGKLVIAFYNPDPIHAIDVPVRVLAETVQYDWLTVEIKNATTTRTLRFTADREQATVESVRIQPHALHFETIDLDLDSYALPAGDYDVIVTWDGQVTTTTLTSTRIPYGCGLARYTPPAKHDSSSSKLPWMPGGLAIAALLLGLAAMKRAGAAVERVPCSPS